MARIEIYVGGKPIPYYESDIQSAILLSYAIARIQDPNARHASYSKDIKLPPSPELNQVYNDIILSSRIADAENTSKSIKDASIVVDGSTVFSGKARLKAYTKANGDPSFYTINFFSDNADWATSLSEVYLSDLGFLSTTWTKANIEASWAYDSDSSDYFWPYINYGALKNADYVAVDDMRPALFWRAIFRKAFQTAGYEIVSTFLDSAYCKRLFTPYSGNFAYTDSFLDQIKFKAKATSDILLSAPEQQVFFADDSSSGFYDTHSDYDASISRHTISRKGVYAYKFDIEYEKVGGGFVQDFNVSVYKNGTFLYAAQAKPDFYAANPAHAIATTKDLSLNAGDYIDFKISAITSLSTAKFKAGSTVEVIQRPDLIVGATVDFASVLDNTIPVYELIKDFCIAFNLQVLTDYQRKKIYIEPRDSFYLPAGTYGVDWTNKLDISQEDEHDPLLYTYARNVWIKYAEDSNDETVKLLQEQTKEPFNSFHRVLPDGFQKGIFELSPKNIAPTIMQDNTMVCPEGVRVPQLWKEHKEGKESPEPFYNFKPRILYFKGLDNSKHFYWTTKTSSYSGFPLSFTVNPDMDGTIQSLSFSNVTENGVTEKGLYHNYHRSFFDTVENGYLYKCRMYLTPADIAALNDEQGNDSGGNAHYPLWRRPIWIKDTWYVLNAITDYNPASPGSVEVELLKYIPAADDVVGTTKRNVAHGIDFPLNITGQQKLPIAVWGGLPEAYSTYLPSSFDPGAVPLIYGKDSYAPQGVNTSAVGVGCIAVREGQVMTGSFPVVSSDTLFAVGKGTLDSDRANAFEVRDNAGTTEVYIDGALLSSPDLSGYVPSTRTLTIAGTTLDLASNQSWSINSDNVVEGTTNLFYNDARVIGSVLTGYVSGANTAVAATDTILQAIEKLQGQVSARLSSVTSTGSTITVTGNNVELNLTHANTWTALQTTNVASGTAADIQIAGSSKLKVDSNGSVVVGSGTAAGSAKLSIPVAPTASVDYGLFCLGSAPFDGVSSGRFVGNGVTNGGTVIAVNSSSSFVGSLADLQVFGSSKFKVDYTGTLTLANKLYVGKSGGGLTSGYTGTALTGYIAPTAVGLNVVMLEGLGNGSSSTVWPVIALRSNRSSNFANDTANAANNVLGSISFEGFSTTTGTARLAAYIQSEVDSVQTTSLSGRIVFHTTNSSGTDIEAMRITSAGNIYGTAGTTGMTNGFFYIPSAAGAPTGTPTAITGHVPMYYDTTNEQFYIYNGSWKKVTLA